ncbi:MAG: alpha/beta fold hydrolase, partial [Chloroflexota bacterium]|nr:alpha/beta fold hydrolase [Chloroflexota bacterium]
MTSKRLRLALRRSAELANRGVLRVFGRPLNPDPLIRLVGLRLLLRRYYGAFVDAHGVSFADVDETFGRMRSLKPASWAQAWRRPAEHYEALGREAESNGRTVTAAELLMRASTLYRIAEIALLDDSPARKELYRACVETFVMAGQLQHPALQRVSIPVGNQAETVGYLSAPAGAARLPAVVIIPGLGMVKEHGDFPQEPLVARGVAALTLDLPGQGENRERFPLTREWAERLIVAAIDWLQTREEIDPERVGLLGTSMGAAAALFTAAQDRRVKAVVEIAGFYYPAPWWQRFVADGIKEFLRYVVGAQDHAELFEVVQSASLRGHVARIACPILVVHGGEDEIVPANEAELIYAEANEPKDKLIFAGGDHGCVNVSEARPLIADWLAQKLRAPHPEHNLCSPLLDCL